MLTARGILSQGMVMALAAHSGLHVSKARVTLKTRPSLRVVVENPSGESPRDRRGGGKKTKAKRRWSPLKHGPARRLKALASCEEGGLMAAMAACFVSVPGGGLTRRLSRSNKVLAELVAGCTPTVAPQRLGDGRTPVPLPWPRLPSPAEGAAV